MPRILGIDPGSRITGYGVIDVHGARQTWVASGCIRCASGSLPERIARIFSAVELVASDNDVDTVAVEKVFMARNPDAALKLGQARGAAIAAVARRGLPVFEYSAREVKRSAVGSGAASKGQIQDMVTRLLSLPGVPQADAADALAVALCHAQQLMNPATKALYGMTPEALS